MNELNNSVCTGIKVFETLKNELLDLTIKPGTEINESEICQRFNVTRPPVRTAFRRLSDMGLLKIIPYHGSFATLLNMDKIYQIIFMRSINETKIIQDFIDSKPKALVIEEIEHNLRQQKIMLKEKKINRQKFFELDNEFHTFWFKHQHCLDIWNIIQEQKIDYQRFRMLDYEKSHQYSEMVEEHEELINAIKKGNKKDIPLILTKHLNSGVKRVAPILLKTYEEYFEKPQDTEFWNDYYKKIFK